MKKIHIFLILILAPLLMRCGRAEQTRELIQSKVMDPLPSWEASSSKEEIIHFVEAVIDTSNTWYRSPEERIAVFDNDGTLWSERPLYFQFYFAMDRIKSLAPQHPEWRDQQPFKAVLEDDMEALLASGTEGLLQMIVATHTGMTNAEFTEIVKDWITTARHPVTGKLYTEMVFQPMLELLTYLRSNGFRTYIVSGGGIEFMRPWAERVYGIPPEQVVGSMMKLEYQVVDGKPTILRLPQMEFMDDQEGKPIGISKFIGRQPIAAFGNSDGDLQMLQWTEAGKGEELLVYIHHTDSVREWAYDRESHIGRLNKGLDEAMQKDWVVVDMQKDWKKIYPN